MFTHLYRLYRRFGKWRQQRILRKHPIPNTLWQAALAKAPWTKRYSWQELQRLRELTTVFVAEKNFIPSKGYSLTAFQMVFIALQACTLILGRSLRDYEDFGDIIVYPDQFIPNHTIQDAAGVIHQRRTAVAGQAWDRGPVLLSWADIEMPFDPQGNLVMHEFAHKLDRRNGAIDGIPEVFGEVWQQWPSALYRAFHQHQSQVAAWETGRATWQNAWVAAQSPSEREGVDTEATDFSPPAYPAINPYGATSVAEFFAVTSEVFFMSPITLSMHYPEWYQLLKSYYRQDPLRRDLGLATSV